MPNTYDYAQLSNTIYGDEVTIPPGFSERIDWPLNDGYSASAFINRLTKEIIIAHKGSDSPLADPGDWIKNNIPHALNIEMSIGQEYLAQNFSLIPSKWLLNIITGKANDMQHWSNQLKESETFVNTIVQSPSFKDYNITQTGHSLGGFLATVNGAKFKTPSVAFDAPASKNYLEYLKQKGDINQEQIDFSNEHSATHLSEGSGIDVIYNPDDYHGTVTSFNLGPDLEGIDLIEKHRMNNIMNNIDPETGLINNGRLIKSGGNVFNRINVLCAEIQSKVQKVRENFN